MPDDLDDRVAAAYEAVAAASGRGAPRRDTAVVEGLRCVVYGVDEPWDGQVFALDVPPPSALAAARAWTLDRSPGCVVVTRQRHLAAPVFAGFPHVHEMPALVLHDRPPAASRVAGVTVGDASDAAEFLAVYGPELAPLVTDADLADPAQTHLVARAGGDPVAVALVRSAGGAAYVSSVTVLPERRRAGLGTLVSAAATERAVGTGAELVWLHATAESRPIYERLGYRLADVHVQLS